MKTQTKFSIEQLKEIEKVFDMSASIVVQNSTKLLTAISPIDKDNKITNKLLDEFISIFDCYRTISAKANEMQKEEKCHKQ